MVKIEMSSLFDDLDIFNKLEIKREAYEEINHEGIRIPEYIYKNIKYNLYVWQENAFKNFLIYNQCYKKENIPTHLMFNMATGSGKTLLMASLILYYYKEGYRHFLFFVNQNNIVDKTENNFIDFEHKKYLFNKTVMIDNKIIQIKKVDMFSENTDSIEIKFTTIQQLHNNIRNIKENINTLEELNSLDIIMLADEGHHFNSVTKKKSQYEFNLYIDIKENSSQEDFENAWEYTVINMLLNKDKYKTNKNNNVLLEFTATIPEHESVKDKYKDKIIYKFPLIDFLKMGYTKEINLLSTQLNKKERILLALLFNWYRHKLSIIFGVANFKAVILFRSKIIEESKSDYKYFIKLIETLNINDFDFIKTIKNRLNTKAAESIYEDIQTKTEMLLYFIKENNIDFNEIVEFIKDSFKEKNIIITNSKTNMNINKEKTDSNIEAMLNNLEDKNNYIRAIFTVHRLTEGWDVLNLFDIVRLNEGQNRGGSNKKTSKATVEEAQLIGRGVRYNPFTASDDYDKNYAFFGVSKEYLYKYKDLEPYKRKFDNDLNNPLRMLEELNYYTYDEESRYISDLKSELKKHGYIEDNRVKKEFFIKDDIKATDFYKEMKVFCNSTIENPNRKQLNLNYIKKELGYYTYKTRDFVVSEYEMGHDSETKLDLSEKKYKSTISIKIKQYPKNIFYKVIHDKATMANSLFSFERLKNELDIKSIGDLLTPQFLGDFEIRFITKEAISYEKILIDDKIIALSNFLDKVFTIFEKGIIEKIGTDFDEKNMLALSKVFGDKKEKLVIKEKQENIEFMKRISSQSWFMLNDATLTSEEQSLLLFIESNIGNIQKKYDEVYLLRNEEVYKIYSFENGVGFKPDYLLFLRNKKSSYYFQVFIEAKGEHLIEKDKFKNDFLYDIKSRYKDKVFKIEDKNYKLTALPMYSRNSLPFENFNDFNSSFKYDMEIE